jgi:hypothetical protein
VSDPTPVLLVDDGELEDVHRLLEELGVASARLRGGAVPERLERPALLFVTTPRHAGLAQTWRDATPARPVRLCIASADSNALREQLRSLGFHLLVRRPVHPFALRLVILRALYRGEERRAEERVVVGREVDVRAGARVNRALLADLSLRAGRLVSPRPLATGSRASLLLPPGLAGGEALALRAKVIRCREVGDAEGPAGFDVALGFEETTPDDRARLARLIGELREATPPGERAGELPAAAPAAATDRRKHPRFAFRGEAQGLGDAAGRSLLGRDLSMGGMRVDPEPGLALGDALRLAIYAAPDEDAVLVRARVVRDDGPGGLALHFEDVSPQTASRIEALVAGLPSVESLQDGEAAALGSVVSEILEREAGADS